MVLASNITLLFQVTTLAISSCLLTTPCLTSVSLLPICHLIPAL